MINTPFKNNYFHYERGSNKKDMLSPDEYFKMIEPYLIELINKHKNDDSWKIQLTMKINFTLAQDFDDKRSLYVKTKNIAIIEGSDINEIINEIFDSLIKKYQELLEYSTKNSGLILEDVESMAYDINKTTINKTTSGSYIESPAWLRNKKCAINPQNKNDNKCFQYSITAVLNYEKINNHPEKISFINQYNWNEIEFPSNQKHWKKYESNNKSIALNILYVPHNTKKIRHAYKSNLILQGNIK